MTNVDIIKNFLTQMSTQDSRATAAPYYYVIRTSEKVYCMEDCGDGNSYLIGDDHEEFDSLFQAAKSLFKDGCSKAEVREYLSNAKTVGWKTEWIHKNMFLTEQDAKEHLRKNHYHYSKDAYTYVDHAWRAPELHAFFNALFDEYKIKRQET